MNKTRWPDGKETAVLVTINLDAELYARAYYPDLKLEGSGYEEKARVGIEVGLPRVLDVLRDYGVKATAFVPGFVAEKYSSSVKDIADSGHEVGARGYAQENLALLSGEEQKKAIKSGQDAVTAACGVAPRGFRAPLGEITLETLEIVHDLGFSYSSSLSDEDTPYFNELKPGKILCEIPVFWSLCDLPYFIFDFWPPIPFGQSRISCFDKVLSNWKWEYDGARRDGSCYVLQIDPTTMGDPGRIFMLEDLLYYISHNGKPWFTTCGSVYDFVNDDGRARFATTPMM
ncbi:polysaccharide deacetylase [Synergistales bacterium]|nr:polysaccharide deacetylase [Synergistales bacterium]